MFPENENKRGDSSLIYSRECALERSQDVSRNSLIGPSP